MIFIFYIFLAFELFLVTCAVGAVRWPPTVGIARLKATSHSVHGISSPKAPLTLFYMISSSFRFIYGSKSRYKYTVKFKKPPLFSFFPLDP